MSTKEQINGHTQDELHADMQEIQKKYGWQNKNPVVFIVFSTDPEGNDFIYANVPQKSAEKLIKSLALSMGREDLLARGFTPQDLQTLHAAAEITKTAIIDSKVDANAVKH